MTFRISASVVANRLLIPFPLATLVSLSLLGCTTQDASGQLGDGRQPASVNARPAHLVFWDSLLSRCATPPALELASGANEPASSDLAVARRADSLEVGSPVARPDSLARTDSVARLDSAATVKPAPLWPVVGPEPLPGSLLPGCRIVAYYGNPLSKRMGILGEVPPDSMLKRLDREVAAWSAADSATPVQPALHLIAVVAQAHGGPGATYRLRMSDSLVEKVASWAERRNALVFLDIQLGRSTLQQELPRLTKFLERPNFHLGIDPEFAMKPDGLPGKRIGSLDAAQVNYAAAFLADIVERNSLPPKVLVIHRFTRPMVTRASEIELDPRVQIVIHMDGWGPPDLKRESYRRYVHSEPVQFTGFKLFYKNDTKRGHPLMKPGDILQLTPEPVYIQYQ